MVKPAFTNTPTLVDEVITPPGFQVAVPNKFNKLVVGDVPPIVPAELPPTVPPATIDTVLVPAINKVPAALYCKQPEALVLVKLRFVLSANVSVLAAPKIRKSKLSVPPVIVFNLVYVPVPCTNTARPLVLIPTPVAALLLVKPAAILKSPPAAEESVRDEPEPIVIRPFAWRYAADEPKLTAVLFWMVTADGTPAPVARFVAHSPFAV